MTRDFFRERKLKDQAKQFGLSEIVPEHKPRSSYNEPLEKYGARDYDDKPYRSKDNYRSEPPRNEPTRNEPTRHEPYRSDDSFLKKEPERDGYRSRKDDSYKPRNDRNKSDDKSKPRNSKNDYVDRSRDRTRSPIGKSPVRSSSRALPTDYEIVPEKLMVRKYDDLPSPPRRKKKKESSPDILEVRDIEKPKSTVITKSRSETFLVKIIILLINATVPKMKIFFKPHGRVCVLKRRS